MPIGLAWLMGYQVHAQCFSSAGTPVGGSQQMGMLDPKVLTLSGFFRYGYFDRYFEGDQVSDVDLIKNADYTFGGTLLSYGLSSRIGLEAELGYFGHKTKRYRMPEGYSLSGSGWSNTLVSAKFKIWQHPVHNLAWSVSSGLKIPFSRHLKAVNHVRLPFDIQPSTGAFGGVLQSYLVYQNSFTGFRYFLYNRFDLNGQSLEEYRFGPSLTTSLFISKHLIKTSSWPVSLTLIAQIRSEYHGSNTLHGVPENSSGSFKTFLSPQINLAFHDLWNLSVLADLPVYQYYNHIQLAERFSLGFSLTRIISPY